MKGIIRRMRRGIAAVFLVAVFSTGGVIHGAKLASAIEMKDASKFCTAAEGTISYSSETGYICKGMNKTVGGHICNENGGTYNGNAGSCVWKKDAEVSNNKYNTGNLIDICKNQLHGTYVVLDKYCKISGTDVAAACGQSGGVYQSISSSDRRCSWKNAFQREQERINNNSGGSSSGNTDETGTSGGSSSGNTSGGTSSSGGSSSSGSGAQSTAGSGTDATDETPPEAVETNNGSKCGDNQVEVSILGGDSNCFDIQDSGNDIFDMLGIILDVLTYGVGAAGVIGIVISAIQYMTAAGNEAQMTKAKNRIIEVVIGLVAYGLMYTFLQWLVPGGMF